MKKLNFFIALVATCVLSMNAQSTGTPLISGVNFYVEGQERALNPYWEDGDDEEDKYLPDTYTISFNSNIDMQFVDYDVEEMTNILGYRPYVMLATGTGFAVNTTFYALDEYKVENNSSQYSFPLDSVKWGDPYMGAFYTTPMVCFLKRTDGIALPSVITQQQMAEDEVLAESIEYYMYNYDPVFFQKDSYTTPNTFAPKLVSVYPNNSWEYETFAEAYSEGIIRFNFSNEISLDEDAWIGEINYTRFDNSRVRPVDIELGVNAEAGWNPMDGYYTITIDYTLAGVNASELSEIEIILDTMQSPYGDVDVDPVLLENVTPNVKRIAKKSQASEGLAVSTENVSVYNIAGMLVKEDIAPSEVNKLPKGLYIVNGKKVVVK